MLTAKEIEKLEKMPAREHNALLQMGVSTLECAKRNTPTMGGYYRVKWKGDKRAHGSTDWLGIGLWDKVNSVRYAFKFPGIKKDYSADDFEWVIGPLGMPQFCDGVKENANVCLRENGVKDTDCVKRNKPTVAGYYKLKWASGYSEQEEIGWYNNGYIHVLGQNSLYTLSSFEYVIGPLPKSGSALPKIPKDIAISTGKPMPSGYYYITWPRPQHGQPNKVDIAWWDSKEEAFLIAGCDSLHNADFKEIAGPIDMSAISKPYATALIVKYPPRPAPAPAPAPVPPNILPSMKELKDKEASGLAERDKENQKNMVRHKEEIIKSLLKKAHDGDRKVVHYCCSSEYEIAQLVTWANSQGEYYAEANLDHRSRFCGVTISIKKKPRQWPRFLHWMIFWRPRT